MDLQVSRHEAHDGELGIEAWVPALVGFATWAPTEADLWTRFPGKLDDHVAWLLRHGLPLPSVGPEFDVVEPVTGGEILFERRFEP